MGYRRYRHSKPIARTITAKFAGKCVCCGAAIKVGEIVTYYPAGTIAGVSQGQIAHPGGLDGTSAKCASNLRQRSLNEDYQCSDLGYEDDCAAKCGL